MSIKERCTQENWSVFCGPPRCQHLGKKPLEKTYLRKKYLKSKKIKIAKNVFKNAKKYKNCQKIQKCKKKIII